MDCGFCANFISELGFFIFMIFDFAIPFKCCRYLKNLTYCFWLWAKYYFSESIISLVKIETSPIAFFSRKVSEKYQISDTILWNWASHILTNKKGKCRKKVNVLQASRFLSLKITELKIQRVSSRFLSFSKKGKCIWAQRQKIGDHYLRRLEKTSQTRQI